MSRSIVLSVVSAVALVAFGGDFQHTLTGTKPWTGENFLDDPQEFHFAVMPDRTGGERPGFFGKAIDTLNLLRPAFVMSVGDLIAGGGVSREKLEAQSDELAGFLSRLKMPFFHVVGNHDIWTGINGRSARRQDSIDVWKERHGTNTYYSFVYKGCTFICLDSMEGHEYFPPRNPIPAAQLDWAAGVMEKNEKARWTFVFMHKPLDWTSDAWLAFERRINRFNYTVFCGDWHTHCTAVRHGKKYYMIGTAGGDLDGGLGDDLRHGLMDSVTWVTMTADGPVVANLALSGVHGDTIQTCATTLGWIEAPLDYPSHLSEDPAAYAHEKNTAVVPAEVMQGPGYDWHFRHAVILRQGKVFRSYPDRFRPKKRRVVLLGDETASARASLYGEEAAVFDMGFAGDRTQNVIWRLQQGELAGYEPDEVVVSVGVHNRGANTDAEIAAAVEKIVSMVRARAPGAKIVR